MNRKIVSVISLVACVLLAVTAFGQAGAAQDPLSGTWTGDWGPSAQDRNRVDVDLKFDGKALTGVVKSTQPARDPVTISNSSYDAATKTVKMEAEAKNPRSGQSVKYVITGKLEGTTITGSWNHAGGRTGDFKLTKK
jgi:hypothetical protein